MLLAKRSLAAVALFGVMASSHAVSITGKELLAKLADDEYTNRMYAYGYVMGIMESASSSDLAGRCMKLPNNLGPIEASEVVTAWARGRRGTDEIPGRRLVLEALASKYPC